MGIAVPCYWCDWRLGRGVQIKAAQTQRAEHVSVHRVFVEVEADGHAVAAS